MLSVGTIGWVIIVDTMQLNWQSTFVVLGALASLVVVALYAPHENKELVLALLGSAGTILGNLLRPAIAPKPLDTNPSDAKLTVLNGKGEK